MFGLYLRVRVHHLNHQLGDQGQGSTVELHTETQNQTPDTRLPDLVSLFLMSVQEEGPKQVSRDRGC